MSCFSEYRDSGLREIPLWCRCRPERWSWREPRERDLKFKFQYRHQPDTVLARRRDNFLCTVEILTHDVGRRCGGGPRRSNSVNWWCFGNLHSFYFEIFGFLWYDGEMSSKEWYHLRFHFYLQTMNGSQIMLLWTFVAFKIFAMFYVSAYESMLPESWDSPVIRVRFHPDGASRSLFIVILSERHRHIMATDVMVFWALLA